MAYQVHLYSRFGEIDAAQAFGALVSRTEADGLRLLVTARTSGGCWEAAQLDRVGNEPGTSGCHVQVSSWSPVVEPHDEGAGFAVDLEEL
ncbi:hypothetical protein GCM10017786_74180 [Amycolatopsis deserti]|uniref:Uncharacterized protein n=1 Tax=Amycolatopsis deserti TaxID=185696 RepID=A0ABQ3JGP9_9PSEU|nr:hypothetical protein [Amycolatopsis deserti]GHF29210.1 hypothetical protein GCM10017786_74180 [Amycolatopsis deserti]